jgi:hypothetical protein
MPQLVEGKLTFHFPEDWEVGKLDDWGFYRNQFAKLGSGLRTPCAQCDAELRCQVCGTRKALGIKAVDILARAPNDTLWLLEVKDYRTSSRTKVIDLADEVAMKVRDSLAALFAAAMTANEEKEKSFARTVVQSMRIRIGLHLEQPKKHSKLFPRAIDLADVQLRMKQLLKSVDPHPAVFEIDVCPPQLWTVC